MTESHHPPTDRPTDSSGTASSDATRGLPAVSAASKHDCVVASHRVYRNYSPEQLLASAAVAARNASQLIRDAEVLARTRSFGHACGLIVTAEEEMAKALVLSLCATGRVSHHGWFKLAFRKHHYKHAAMSVVVLVSALKRMYRPAFPRRSRLRNGTVNLIAVLNRTSDIIGRPKYLFAQLTRILSELRTLVALESVREKAFYASLRPSADQQIKAREFRLLLRMARGHYASVKWGSMVGKRAADALRESSQVMTANDIKASRELEDWLFDKNGLNTIVTYLRSTDAEHLLLRFKEFPSIVGTSPVAGPYAKLSQSLRELASLLETGLRRQRSKGPSPSSAGQN